MSWVGRKLAQLDDIDQKQVIQEYFEKKKETKVLFILEEEDTKEKKWRIH